MARVERVEVTVRMDDGTQFVFSETDLYPKGVHPMLVLGQIRNGLRQIRAKFEGVIPIVYGEQATE